MGCATDLFSNFCIVDKVKDNLCAKQVLDFIQLKIISVFGHPRILVTDNASCMNNQLVSQACAVLNIHFCTISPYSAKSNLQELLNRKFFLNDYFSKHKPIAENQKLRIKVDIGNIKLLTNSLLVNSNRSENFYRNFFEENRLPPTFYVSQDDTRTQVRRLEEITQQDDSENLEFHINLVRKFMKRQPRSKSSILLNSRKIQINKIVEHLKPQQPRKRVRFNEQVTC